MPSNTRRIVSRRSTSAGVPAGQQVHKVAEHLRPGKIQCCKIYCIIILACPFVQIARCAVYSEPYRPVRRYRHVHVGSPGFTLLERAVATSANNGIVEDCLSSYSDVNCVHGLDECANNSLAQQHQLRGPHRCACDDARSSQWLLRSRDTMQRYLQAFCSAFWLFSALSCAHCQLTTALGLSCSKEQRKKTPAISPVHQTIYVATFLIPQSPFPPAFRLSALRCSSRTSPLGQS